MSEAELLSRLEEALNALPPEERAAAVVAYGLGEGSTGVAVELDLETQDAEALARSALQLLRASLADVDTEAHRTTPVDFGGLAASAGGTATCVPGDSPRPTSVSPAPTGPRVIGLLGGMSWESSAEYYRLANELVRERLGGLHSARVLLVLRRLRRHRVPAGQRASGTQAGQAAGARAAKDLAGGRRRAAGDLH